jgi:hypothetical protein
MREKRVQGTIAMVIGFAQLAHDRYSYKQSHKITRLSIPRYVRLLRMYMNAGVKNGMRRRIS